MFWRSRKSREQDLDRELAAHLDLEAEEHRDSGMDETQARFAAHRALGNIVTTKEEVRSMWGWTRWEILLQDIRFAWRTLRKSPGFAITAILTLAVGIGASTAVFTVVDSVILRPLSYRDSGQLVAAWEHVRFLGDGPVGPNPIHVDLWRQRSNAFRGLTVVRNIVAGLTLGDGSPRLTGTVVCLPNLFDVLQVTPVLGRGFRSEDGVKGRDNVAILTHSLWKGVFHGDPNIVGKTIRVDDVPREVVGILPVNFHFPNAGVLRAFASPFRGSAPEPDLFIPVVFNPSAIEWGGNYGNWIALGRLLPGIGIPAAEAQLNTVQEQIMREFLHQAVDGPRSLRASVQPMHEAVVGDAGKGIWLLMTAVAGLMLIACLNLANAQLGRALTHRRDAAVRAALGAAKWRLIWNVLAENLLLSLIGGSLGMFLASGALSLLRRYSPIDLPRLSEIHLNLTVLFFSAGLVIVVSFLSGILPALKLMSADPQVSLQQNSTRTLGNRSSQQTRSWLIGLQVFGCTVLLLVTGLFCKSLLTLLTQDKGLETAQVAVADVLLSRLYVEPEKRINLIDAVLQNLRSIPGVESAGFVSAMPFAGESWIEFARRPDRPNEKLPLINARWVSPGYFETTGQKLIAGRFFEERDRNLNSVVLSEGESKALWGNEDPIGGQVNLLGKTFTVIGVVGDSKSTSLKTAPTKMAYVHYTYRTPHSIVFLVRGMLPPDVMLSSMREAIVKYASNVTIARVKMLDVQLIDSLTQERFRTFVFMSFGTAALLLAMLGIYGVLSYSMTARRQEIGVRMALGATPKSVYRLTMAEAGTPVVAGLITGIAASLMTGHLIEKFLYGTKAIDPVVILTITTLFLLAAAIAVFIPARRAASVNPVEALRAE